LEDRCDDLLSEYEERWLGPIPGCLEEWRFHRGFVESLTIRDEADIETCSGLFDRHSHRSVTCAAIQARPCVIADRRDMSN